MVDERQPFIPKLFSILKNEKYSKADFLKDATAGIVVGIVALPLAIAFAIASGVKPEQGLYTAIIAGAVIALLGGSRTQVSGPTGAFIVIIADIVNRHGYEGLAVATFMAGFILMLLGISGMGILLRLIPYPLIVGFTSGIAVIIFSSQVKDFLGLQILNFPSEFIDKWKAVFGSLDTYRFSTLVIGVITLLILFLWPKISVKSSLLQKIPGSLIAIIFTSLIVGLFRINVDTISKRFIGGVPNSLPELQHLNLSWQMFKEMSGPAMTIAMLGAIESLLSAVVADGMIGTKHRSNMELFAQGVGNVISPLFGGIPATGAIARTAMNVKSGGRTPISAIIHSIFILIIMLFLGKLAGYIPMSTLAAVLIYVAYNMSEWHSFIRIFKYPKADILIMLVTFFLTILVDLTVAIEAGLLVSLFFFVKKMDFVSGAKIITEEIRQNAIVKEDAPKLNIPDDVEVFEVFGPLFFSVIERFKTALNRLESHKKTVIINMEDVPLIDGSAVNAIESLYAKLKFRGTNLVLAGVMPEPFRVLNNAEILKDIKVFDSLAEALNSVS